MNSKFCGQIICFLFFVYFFSNTLASPVIEDKRTANHKLMRFGRDPSNSLMNYNEQRNIDSNEEEIVPNDYLRSNEYQKSFYDFLLKNLNQKGNEYFRKNDDYLLDLPERRSQPNQYLHIPKKFYFNKKADNRDNVFMHFG